MGVRFCASEQHFELHSVTARKVRNRAMC
jgi:hypothetical protein